MLDRRVLAPHALARWAAEIPDSPVVEHVDGDRLTYSELLHASYRWASSFEALGVTAGTRVASLLPNIIEAHCTMLGLSWLRAVEVPLNVAYVGDMLRHALALSESEMVVTTNALLPRIAEIAAELPALRTVMTVDGPPDHSLPNLARFELRTVPEDVPVKTDFAGPEVWDISTLLFTSGTTGPSKAVVSPWGLTYNMWSWVPEDTLGPGESMFLALPLFHNSGRSGFNYVLSRGGCLVTRDKFSATSVWDDVRKHNCVALALVGPLTALLYDAPPRDDDADNPVRSVILGPMIPQIEDFKKRFGVRVTICYGQTEIGAPITATSWEHGPWQNCGRRRETWPWHEVRIVDEHDEPVPVGEVGELIVRTAEPWGVNLGYYGMPEAGVEAWRNGWFHTGDAFREDADGYFYFVDRMRDTIRRRGENISSFEVEHAVGSHPGVRECAAVGMPTAYGDDEVFVAVIPAGPDLDPAELVAYLTTKLPAFMVPRYVHVVDDLPRNATTGRVRKTEIRAAGLPAEVFDRLATG
jgi:crotonobetaine/carnitine-CoA ligase